MKNLKHITVTCTFLAILMGLFAASLLKPSTDVSRSERRRLAQFPEFSAEEVFGASFMKGFDDYATDQFFGRETFRSVKAVFDREVLRKSDTNKLFMRGDDVFKIEYPLHEDKVTSLAARLTALRDKYMQGMNVYYTIVPDKNYFLPADGGYLTLDYDRLRDLMQEGMTGMTYIDLFGTLSLEDYYNTDGHWRQERLSPIARALGDGMGHDLGFNLDNYEAHSFDKFYGAYYGQSARQLTPDTLVWLENDITRNAIVESYDQSQLPMYNLEDLDGMDAYDLYLHGMQPLLFLTNPMAQTEKKLILFRDSYGSALAPVLLEDYSKITVVDLRYIQPDILGQFIDFGDDTDVLMMFSATIINNSDIIR